MTAPRTQTTGTRLSLAARLAWVSAGAGLIVGATAIAIAYIALSQQMNLRVQSDLAGKRSLVAHVVSETPLAESMGSQAHRLNDVLVGHDDLHLVIVTPAANRVLASFSAIAIESLQQVSPQAGIESRVDWQSRDGQSFTSLTGTGHFVNGDRALFILSQNRASDLLLLRGLLEGAVVGLPVLLLFIVAGAWVVARTGLVPLKRFEKVARASSTRDLTQRLRLDDLPRELQDLAVAFNAMLGRIDAGVLKLNRLAGDLAHEMRTPVATLIGQSQVALSRSRTTDELRSVIERNIEELERLSRLISDMLFLARAENESEALLNEQVDLSEEANRIREFLALMAEERGVAIEVIGCATVEAERVLVQRAITNLVSNAIRHAWPRSTIRLEVAALDKGATLTVVNAGKSIPPEHLHHLFDRFYRADSSRARHDGGSGLGLAIVQAIIRMHGGTVDVRSRTDDAGQGETRFKLTFVR